MNILTIVNFIRGVEPRTDAIDLLLPVKRQYELIKAYDFPSTFLFQHDALTNPRFTELIQKDDKTEVGLWLELNKDLVERAGVSWHGREGYFWDWQANAGLTAGYTPKEREKIVDVAMEDFKKVFSAYPKTVAAWSIDAVTLSYLESKYHVVASMNCKDQWGTDGYSLWGGYYSQAYYPSKNNAFCPANSADEQIDLPIFRMLGSDPIDQYSCAADSAGQHVVSLEPVYPDSGGDEAWVKWFFRETFNNRSLSFGYAQAGQENSFGWPKMEKGYLFQMDYIKKQHEAGLFELMTVSEAGQWYKKTYALTPASAIVAKKDDGRSRIWYCSRFYRMNVYHENHVACFQDLFVFDEQYKERYLNDTCKDKNLHYDNLPIIDSYRCSGNERAGAYFYEDGALVHTTGEWSTSEKDASTLKIDIPTEKETIGILCEVDRLCIKTTYHLVLQWEKEQNAPKESPQGLSFTYNGYTYQALLEKGTASVDTAHKKIEIMPEQGRIVLCLKQR